MKHARHFENVNRTSAREAECIGTMIADMRRVVKLLDCDVQTEEERWRIFDRSDAQYPMLARTLVARATTLKRRSPRSKRGCRRLTQLSRLNSCSQPDPWQGDRKTRHYAGRRSHLHNRVGTPRSRLGSPVRPRFWSSSPSVPARPWSDVQRVSSVPRRLNDRDHTEKLFVP